MMRKNMMIALPMIILAFALRMVQVLVFVDYKTGFYNRGDDLWGMLITIAVLAICFVAALVSRGAFEKGRPNGGLATSVASFLVSAALFYELIAEKTVIQGAKWQSVAMKTIGLIAAIYFLAVGLAKLLNFKIPDLVHIVPSLYMMIRTVCSFVNVTSLSLIAENIFFVTGLCCVLLFFVSYAAFNCLEDSNKKSFGLRAVLAFSVCLVSSGTNIIVNFFVKSGYYHIPLYSQLVMLALVIYIGVFTFESCFKTAE